MTDAEALGERKIAPMPKLWATRAIPLLSLLAACSCDEDPLSFVPPTPSDGGFVPIDAGFPVEDAGPTDTGVPEARTLRFDGTSPVALFFGAQRNLRFLLTTAGGAPVPNAQIRFASSGMAGSLSTSSVQTDANGAGLVLFTAGAAAGQGTITASADLATDVAVSVQVSEDPSASLRVDLSSSTRIPVTTGEARIYVGPSGSVPSCASLLSSTTPPAPTQLATYPNVPGTYGMTNQQSGRLVTVLATGKNAAGLTVGRRCVEGTRLNGGVETRIQVVLEQLPSDLTGTYAVLTAVDLGQVLPPPYEDTIILITDILSDPAGWAVYQTLAQFDQDVGTVFVTWVPPNEPNERLATFQEVRNNSSLFNTWRIASAWLDDLFVDLLGQTYVDLTNIGGDIADTVRAFDVGAEYELSPSTSANRMDVVESWKALVFEWRTGCPAGDMGCARRPVELTGQNAHLAPLQATYGATVSHAPIAMPAPGETERFVLALDEHAINLRYGAILVIVLNEIIFPSLPPSIAGNSIADVLGNVVDCPSVGQALANATGLSATVFELLCDTAVIAAATAVENRILQLDSNNNPDLLGGASPSGGGQLVLVDANHDLATELVPELTSTMQWSTAGGPAPIVGTGRRDASDCADDSECGSGASCMPIPHYLKVQALEQDCRRSIGGGAGGSACAQPSDCASGVCFDPGSGSFICFGACDGGSACGSGTCTVDALSVDLDPVLAGLGEASASACVP